MSYRQCDRQNDVPDEDEQWRTPRTQASSILTEQCHYHSLTTVWSTSHHKHSQDFSQVQQWQPPWAPNGVVQEVHHKYPKLKHVPEHSFWKLRINCAVQYKKHAFSPSTSCRLNCLCVVGNMGKIWCTCTQQAIHYTEWRMNSITLHMYLSMYLMQYKYTDNNKRNL